MCRYALSIKERFVLTRLNLLLFVCMFLSLNKINIVKLFEQIPYWIFTFYFINGNIISMLSFKPFYVSFKVILLISTTGILIKLCDVEELPKIQWIISSIWSNFNIEMLTIFAYFLFIIHTLNIKCTHDFRAMIFRQFTLFFAIHTCIWS